MNYEEMLANAKEALPSNFCRVCRDCNGEACRGVIPGPGGKDSGEAFVANRKALKRVKLRMDTIYAEAPIDASVELFGRRFEYPVFAAPIGAVEIHYGHHLTERQYDDAIVGGCAAAGTAAFTGDGAPEFVFGDGCDAVAAAGGLGIPTVKPWKSDELLRKLRLAEAAGSMAVACDVDAAGLALLKAGPKQVEARSVDQLAEVIASANVPFILKGIMTAGGAQKALDAGAYGIVISNHGGRVLDDSTTTLDALREIAPRFAGRLKLFIDGGFRTGADVFKAIALGADAVLIGRPCATAAYGGGAEGVELYIRRIGVQLRDVMAMTGAMSLADIKPEMVTLD